jgi:3-oxoacyl-[acyl-carrier-protein] synthase-3
MSKIKIRVVGTGSYLPPNIVTNEQLSTVIETNDEWIKTRTGISQRHIAGADENTSDLATKALQNALSHANLSGNDLDAIIVTTTTPDLIFPSVGIKVQQNVGMQNGFAFDIQTVCSGFVYATYTAEKFLRSGDVKRVAVVGAETMSRILNWNDRSTCVLFGDGAGAVILESYESDDPADSDIIDVMLATKPSLQDALYACDNSFSAKNLSMEKIAKFLQPKQEVTPQEFGIHMNGAAVYKNAVEGMTEMSLKILERNKMKLSDVKWLLLHQANMRITKSIAERLQIPENRVMESISECANTSVATIPISLDKYVKNNPELQHGDIILMATAGAGMTFSSALLRW